jgi:hypothetical protein
MREPPNTYKNRGSRPPPPDPDGPADKEVRRKQPINKRKHNKKEKKIIKENKQRKEHTIQKAPT